MHLYKLQGYPETYSKYNEGWMDAIAFIDARVSALHEEYIRDLAWKYWNSIIPDDNVELMEHSAEVTAYIDSHGKEFGGYIPM